MYIVSTQIFHTVEYDEVKIEEKILLQDIVFLLLLLPYSVIEALLDNIVLNTAVSKSTKRINFLRDYLDV